MVREDWEWPRAERGLSRDLAGPPAQLGVILRTRVWKRWKYELIKWVVSRPLDGEPSLRAGHYCSVCRSEGRDEVGCRGHSGTSEQVGSPEQGCGGDDQARQVASIMERQQEAQAIPSDWSLQSRAAHRRCPAQVRGPRQDAPPSQDPGGSKAYPSP